MFYTKELILMAIIIFILFVAYYKYFKSRNRGPMRKKGKIILPKQKKNGSTIK